MVAGGGKRSRGGSSSGGRRREIEEDSPISPVGNSYRSHQPAPATQPSLAKRTAVPAPAVLARVPSATDQDAGGVDVSQVECSQPEVDSSQATEVLDTSCVPVSRRSSTHAKAMLGSTAEESLKFDKTGVSFN